MEKDTPWKHHSSKESWNGYINIRQRRLHSKENDARDREGYYILEKGGQFTKEALLKAILNVYALNNPVENMGNKN